MNIFVGHKATDFYSKNSIMIIDLDNVVGKRLRENYIKPNQVEDYESKGWKVDVSTKNGFGCHNPP